MLQRTRRRQQVGRARLEPGIDEVRERVERPHVDLVALLRTDLVLQLARTECFTEQVACGGLQSRSGSRRRGNSGC